jgi:SNW domain-containing protein 1
MQQLLAQKEKAQKEENLRMLAQRAREERSGITPSVAGGSAVGGASKPPPVMGLGGYGSDSDEDSDEEDEEEEEDDEAVREREEVRAEKRREREKQMRMNNMGTEMRAKLLAK